MAVNKSQEAKDYVENKIAKCFGSDYVTSTGGKIYVNAKSNDGEVIQVAISLTCPKTPIVSNTPIEEKIGFDWSGTPVTTAPVETLEPQSASEEEMNNIAILLSSLGL